MTPLDRPDRPFSADSLNAALSQVGGTARPDYLDDLLGQVARTSQRPAWTFLERWIPMTLLAPARARPRTLQPFWRLALIVALSAAVAAGIALAGMMLLRQDDAQRMDSSVSVPTYSLLATWDASSISGLSVPSGLDVGPDGTLYVVNAGTSEVLVLRPDGAVLDRWGTFGTGEGQFDFLIRPEDVGYSLGAVAVGPDGTVSVADLMNDRIQQFHPGDPSARDDGFLRSFGAWGTESGQFFQPYELVADTTGDIYVVDNVRGDVQRFGTDGTFRGIPVATGNIAAGPTYVDGGLAVHDGEVSVVDYEHGTVNTWASDGTLRRTIGQDGTGPARLANPFDVAIDSQGAVLVTESDRVVVYGPDGRFASEWAAPHDRSAEDWLNIAVAPDGTAYVSAPRQGRIYKLGIAEMTSRSPSPVGPTPAPTEHPIASAPSPSRAGATAISIDGTIFPIPFTVELPERWTVYEETRGRVSMRVTREPGTTPVYVVVSIPLNAYADPCHAADGPTDPRVGPGVDDLVDALTHLAGYRPTTVADETLDGFAAKAFDLENASLEISTCSDDPWLRIWTYDNARSGPVKESPDGDAASAHSRVAILDVHGTRVLVWLWAVTSDARLDEVLQAEKVIDSIDFR